MTSRLPKLVAFDLEYVLPDDIGKGLVNCIVGCQPHRRYLNEVDVYATSLSLLDNHQAMS